jgi:hypothetical protein
MTKKSEGTLGEKFDSENPESQRVESEGTLGEKFDSENPESQRVESDVAYNCDWTNECNSCRHAHVQIVDIYNMFYHHYMF